MKIIEKTLESTGGLNTLRGFVYEPEGEIRGIVQIVHGKSEHIERYAPLMEALCGAGFAAFGHNHIGHKGSSPDEELGFFGYDHGFRTLINDVNAFGDAVAADYPGKKRFLYGHSMGSFIVRLAVLRQPERFSGLIVCGTGGPNPAAGAGLLACNLVILARGGKYISPILENLAFGKYNDRFDGEGGFRWLSTDGNEVEKYEEDKYCGFPFTACGMHDLVKLNQVCNKKIWYDAVSDALPIFLISGSDDPVGDYGKGVTAVYEGLKAKSRNVRMKLYDGARHEIHNEFCRQEVFADIIGFIEENL